MLLTTTVVVVPDGALALLIVYVTAALVVSFVCSILEAVLLTARVSELSARKEAGERGAGVLLALKEQRIDDAIAVILILNTVAHTVGATMSGKQAALVWREPLVTVFAIVLTLAVLILTEIIPKTIGTVHASRLVGFAGHTIKGMIALMRPALVLTKFITRLVAHGRKESITRREIRALVAMATRAGTIGVHESKALHNLLLLERVLVEDVMTPRTVVKMMREEDTAEDLLKDEDADIFSRIPLRRESKDEVVGYVLQRDVIREALRSGKRNVPLSRWRREVRFIPETATLGKALHMFLEVREHLLIVVDEYGGVSGLVTLEDVLESILGVEIIDEKDRVEDLRHSAAELRDRRMQRHRHALDAPSSAVAGDAGSPLRVVDGSDTGPHTP